MPNERDRLMRYVSKSTLRNWRSQLKRLGGSITGKPVTVEELFSLLANKTHGAALIGKITLDVRGPFRCTVSWADESEQHTVKGFIGLVGKFQHDSGKISHVQCRFISHPFYQYVAA